MGSWTSSGQGSTEITEKDRPPFTAINVLVGTSASADAALIGSSSFFKLLYGFDVGTSYSSSGLRWR